MVRSADGWIGCARGHTHWGRVGAAGLLVIHTDDAGTSRYLLQHRSDQVQHGLTWGIPGGALAHRESPIEGALREADEEMTPLLLELEHRFTYTDDHDGWAYHTVVMDSLTMPELVGGWETGPGGFRWAPEPEIGHMKLHPGFAATWHHIVKELS